MEELIAVGRQWNSKKLKEGRKETGSEVGEKFFCIYPLRYVLRNQTLIYDERGEVFSRIRKEGWRGSRHEGRQETPETDRKKEGRADEYPKRHPANSDSNVPSTMRK